MSNIMLQPPESPPAPAEPSEPIVAVAEPAVNRTPIAPHAVREPVQPTSRSLYWRPKSSDMPALSVLLGLIVVALVVLSLVIALISGGSTTIVHTSSGSGSMAGMSMPSSGSSTAQYPVHNVPAHPTYEAQPAAAPTGDVVDVTLVAKQALISIAPDVAYHAWTFNGTVPGPIIRVRQGQTINFTLENQDSMAHSIDFHAAQTPWDVNYQPVQPGKSFSFTFKASYPGVFIEMRPGNPWS